MRMVIIEAAKMLGLSNALVAVGLLVLQSFSPEPCDSIFAEVFMHRIGESSP